MRLKREINLSPEQVIQELKAEIIDAKPEVKNEAPV